MKNLKNLYNLPEHFEIKTLYNRKTGVWVAVLTQYDLCTEADGWIQLILSVNDLIYTVFDIPEAHQKKITFLPESFGMIIKTGSSAKIRDSVPEVERNMIFNVLVAPKLLQKHSNA